MSQPEDKEFEQRIQNAFKTVQAWDEDPKLLEECRKQIPFAELRKNNYPNLSKTHNFVRNLAKHFQSIMTWVNQPPCPHCQTTEHVTSTQSQQTQRPPETDEEKLGQASRVELYKCNNCLTDKIPFPRYNSVKKLLETKQGRCGEYANLFGLFCRCCGLDTRYILDMTDHVWVEVLLLDDDNNRYIMVDACEGVTDENSMYEHGWKKNLNYIIAIHSQYVLDVTPKYTRKFQTSDFLARRRALTSSEEAGNQVIRTVNRKLQEFLPAKKIQKIRDMLARQEAEMEKLKHLTEWDDNDNVYKYGRISGSLAWKIARQEMGTTDNANEDQPNNNKSRKIIPSHYYVETYYPLLQEKLTIVVERNNNKEERNNNKITVNGISCAIGSYLSVVVLDEKYLGCILQSRCFDTLSDFSHFVDTLPDGRIVVAIGTLSPSEKLAAAGGNGHLPRLGAFDSSMVAYGVLYIGQVMAEPDWAWCGRYEAAPNGFQVVMTNDNEDVRPIKGTSTTLEHRKLRTIRHTHPQKIAGRLPESIMPLETQKLANHQQKRTAFLKYLDDSNDSMMQCCGGYTTRPGVPVYLLGETSYPLSPDEAALDIGEEWSTFLLLPPPLVPDSDQGIPDASSSKTNTPQFDVPLDAKFFVLSLGDTLLSGQNRIPTEDALQNTRLVGLYFSAHWCGPCRSFTPVLAEMYQILKESNSTHGLEIVFVSSDRDQHSFDSYFASMPWLAIPFESLGMYKQALSVTYGVRGIPSLVILDAMSGNIVVPNSETRQQIIQAARRGDDGMIDMFQNQWLEQVPDESKQLLRMLQVSCTDVSGEDQTSLMESPEIKKYLVREAYREKEERLRTLTEQLVADGVDAEEAATAAKAVEDVATEDESVEVDLPSGPLNGRFKRSILDEKSNSAGLPPKDLASKIENASGRDQLAKVLATVAEYLDNCRKEPWTTKFRSFQLSFKVADRINSVPGGLEILQSLGFTVEHSSADFMVCIPVYADLDQMNAQIQSILPQ